MVKMEILTNPQKSFKLKISRVQFRKILGKLLFRLFKNSNTFCYDQSDGSKISQTAKNNKHVRHFNFSKLLMGENKLCN